MGWDIKKIDFALPYTISKKGGGMGNGKYNKYSIKQKPRIAILRTATTKTLPKKPISIYQKQETILPIIERKKKYLKMLCGCHRQVQQQQQKRESKKVLVSTIGSLKIINSKVFLLNLPL